MSVATKETSVSKELSAEIDEGVKELTGDSRKIGGEVVEEEEDKTVEKDDKDDIPSEEVLEDDETEEDDSSEEGEEATDESDDDDKNSVIPDELIERAVQSRYFSLTEAKNFASADLLEKMCDKLDAQSKTDEKSAKAEDVDPLDDIPALDMTDLEEDDPIVKGFNSLKDIVAKQREEIRSLRIAGEKSAVNGFFDTKVLGLDKDFAQALADNPEKRDALRKQHEVLVAGYKATGEEISQDKIFDQAVSAVLGDVKISITEKKLSKREKQHIKRPGGPKTKVVQDPMDEIAETLDNKYFKKK